MAPDAPDLRRAQLVEELIPLQAVLRQDFASAFGGLWIDDQGIPHVAVTSARRDIERVVMAANVHPTPVIREVRFTELELGSAMSKISHQLVARNDGLGLTIAGVDVKGVRESLQNNAIFFNIEGSLAAGRSTLREEFGEAIEVESTPDRFGPTCSSRVNCGSPVKAGLQLYRNTSGLRACMSAFVAQDWELQGHYYLMSAGHCWASSTPNRYHPTTFLLGTTSGEPHPVETPVDVMRIPITDAQASIKLYVSNSLIRPVTAVESLSAEVVGQQVCSSQLSGVRCGYLQSKNICTVYGVCGSRLASHQYTCGGDSGSPVYVVIGTGPSVRAIGIMIAGTSGTNPCPDGETSGHQGIYTHIKNAEPWLGVKTQTTVP